MALRNSKIIIAKNVRMDRDYINIVRYNETQMLSLLRSGACLIAENSNYSFIRDKGTIEVAFTYAQCVIANYVAFQNPDYSNKWFFAWIDKVNYINDNNVEIEYTIDYWSTWNSNFNFVPVLVEREHVSDDTFGTHLLPEPVRADITEVQYTRAITFDSYDMIVTKMYSQAGTTPQQFNGRYVETSNSTAYPASSAGAGMDEIYTESTTGNLIAVSLFPSAYTGRTGTTQYPQPVSNDITISAPSNLHGYIPVNNKLFTYPYSYLTVDNCSNKRILRYENFPVNYFEQNGYTFTVRGYASTVNELSIIPNWYEGVQYNSYNGLSIKDFPQLPTKVDSYAAWLAQKSNATIFSGLTNTISGAGAGAMAGGAVGAVVGAVGGLTSGIGSYLTQEQSAKDAPDSIRGGNSSSINDIIFGVKGFYVKQVSLRADVAKTVDNFFSKYGYACNEVKIPNLNNRTYWNYVKINGVAGYGELPENARSRINQMFNDGVTIWHNHSNIGNYLIGGNKMENPIV